MGKVVGIKGGTVTQIREPDADVERILLEVLAAARSGEVQGVAIGLHYADGSGGGRWAGTVRFSLVGRLAAMQRRILASFEDE
jgi:hypothetical protein